MVIDTKNTTNRKNSRSKTTKDSELGDGKNYPECRTGIKRWKYEKKLRQMGYPAYI